MCAVPQTVLQGRQASPLVGQTHGTGTQTVVLKNTIVRRFRGLADLMVLSGRLKTSCLV